MAEITSGDAVVELARLVRVERHKRRSKLGKTEDVDAHVRKVLDSFGSGADADTKKAAFVTRYNALKAEKGQQAANSFADQSRRNLLSRVTGRTSKKNQKADEDAKQFGRVEVDKNGDPTVKGLVDRGVRTLGAGLGAEDKKKLAEALTKYHEGGRWGLAKEDDLDLPTDVRDRLKGKKSDDPRNLKVDPRNPEPKGDFAKIKRDGYDQMSTKGKRLYEKGGQDAVDNYYGTTPERKTPEQQGLRKAARDLGGDFMSGEDEARLVQALANYSDSARSKPTPTIDDLDLPDEVKKRVKAAKHQHDDRKRRIQSGAQLSALSKVAENVLLTQDDHDLIADIIELGSRASLDRSPKKNWVENTGELPGYIREIARSIEKKRGVPLSRAIALAIGAIKRWARGGSDVDADTRAKAAAALAKWEALKTKNKARKKG